RLCRGERQRSSHRHAGGERGAHYFPQSRHSFDGGDRVPHLLFGEERAIRGSRYGERGEAWRLLRRITREDGVETRSPREVAGAHVALQNGAIGEPRVIDASVLLVIPLVVDAGVTRFGHAHDVLPISLGKM